MDSLAGAVVRKPLTIQKMLQRDYWLIEIVSFFFANKPFYVPPHTSISDHVCLLVGWLVGWLVSQLVYPLRKC